MNHLIVKVFACLIIGFLAKKTWGVLGVKNEKQYEYDSYMDSLSILQDRFVELKKILVEKVPQGDQNAQFLILRIEEISILLKKNLFWESNPAYDHHEILSQARDLFIKYDIDSNLGDDIVLEYELEEPQIPEDPKNKSKK